MWDDERAWAVILVIAGTPLATWIKGKYDERKGEALSLADAGMAAIGREAKRAEKAGEAVVDWMSRALQAEARETVLKGEVARLQRDLAETKRRGRVALVTAQERPNDIDDIVARAIPDADEAPSMRQVEPVGLDEIQSMSEASDAEEGTP